jgi:hypothetical protein
MASTSGIHFNSMFFENNHEYSEFLFLAKSIIQGSQEASNIKSNSEGDASWALLLSIAFGQSKHVVSLALHCKFFYCQRWCKKYFL